MKVRPRPLPKNFRLRLFLRGQHGLSVTPPTNGQSEGKRGQAVVLPEGRLEAQPEGKGRPLDGQDAGVLAPNDEPLRRRIFRRGRRKWWIHLILKIWKKIYRFWPWRELTEEEKQELEERKRRKALEALLKSEAKIAIRVIQRALDRRGLSYRQRKGDGTVKRIDYVKFDVVALQPEALYLRVDVRRLPYGVGILDLVEEDILTDLSLALGRRVLAQYSEKKGLWYIIERASGVRGIPKHVKFVDMIEHMPRTADLLTIPLGMTVNARRVYRSLADFPHLLIAGATNTGKSNMVNVILCTFIMRNRPEDLRMILVDLKGGMEFTFYENIPHLLEIPDLTQGIIYEREQVPRVLDWLIQEGERRMALLKESGHKNIGTYNLYRRKGRLHRILLVIDEWADIKLVRGLGREAEEKLANIASRMRAVGIHVILATQVPKSEVISTLIKTNLPGRMAFSCPSYTASQLIIDVGDARGLSPQGRYIFALGGEMMQIQAPYIPDRLIREIVARAISGETMMDLDATDVTPEEILTWALDHLDGRLTVASLFRAFRGRITQRQLRTWLSEWEGETFILRGRKYIIEPGEGSRPRRLVLVEE